MPDALCHAGVQRGFCLGAHHVHPSCRILGPPGPFSMILNRFLQQLSFWPSPHIPFLSEVFSVVELVVVVACFPVYHTCQNKVC